MTSTIPKRLYPAELPEVGDIVMVKITEIGDDMIYCHLLEYDKQGMLPYSEISRKKVRNIRRFVRIGNQESMEVTNVDNDKGYIDLSRKQISDTEKEECLAQYTAAKRMHTFFYRWSTQSGEDLIVKILWPSYRSEQIDVYNKLVIDRAWQDSLPESWQERVQEDFYRLFDKKAEKYELNVEMVCYSLEGVNALQEATDKAMELTTEDIPLQCIYTGKTGEIGNIFQLCTVTKSDNALDVLNTAADTMRQSLSQYPSRFLIV